MHSFYLLYLAVEPGGAHKNDFYIFNTLEEVMGALKKDLVEDHYLALWYGEYITLSVFSEGRSIWEKDLHPYITFHVPGYLPLKCDTKGALHLKSSRIVQNDPESRQENDEDEDEKEILDEILLEEALLKRKSISVDIDWASLEIPKLKGKLAQNGETVMFIEGGSLSDDMKYGYNDRA